MFTTDLRMIFATFSVTVFIMIQIMAGTLAQSACTNTTCSSDQFCSEVSQIVICRSCDDACEGCTGFGNSNCKRCKAGYHLVDGICTACPSNTFGVNCTGVCHCLLGASDCRPLDGKCTQCAQGWTNFPYCQIPMNTSGENLLSPCDNTTFGSNCENTCHCPPGDTCSAINGICSSGTCAVGWGGPSCQILLPKMVNPPQVSNVSCKNVTVKWPQWKENFDIGTGPIGRYILWYKLNSNSVSWQTFVSLEYNSSTSGYEVHLIDLTADTFYIFRLDIKRVDTASGKLMNATPGFVSDPVFIPCTVTTTQAPGLVTTLRPSGSHLLNDTLFTVRPVNDTTLQVSWRLVTSAENYTINVMIAYYMTRVGNCQSVENATIHKINVTKSGSHNISDLLPWRQYTINLTAVNEHLNITDYIIKAVDTWETKPTGIIKPVNITNVMARSVSFSWNNLSCPERGGILLYYTVMVHLMNLNSSTIAFKGNTSSTEYHVQNLLPSKTYGVVVLYVNSKGSAEFGNFSFFTTIDDFPEKPTIAAIFAVGNTFTVTVDPPNITNGNLRQYMMAYELAENNFTSGTFILQEVVRGPNITVRGLLYDREYSVKVSVSTMAGFGNYSEVRKIRTQLGLPEGPPVSLSSDNTARNETCLNITWEEPSQPNGVIIDYQVNYTEVGSDTISKVVAITVNSTYCNICNLTAGQLYIFTVRSRNAGGYGPSEQIRVFTEHGTPPKPPPPIFITATESTITVALDPVIMSARLLTAYAVFVKDLMNQRKRRQGQVPNITCPGNSSVLGDMVAKLQQNDILQRTEFQIGDNNTYGGIRNYPLTKDHFYDISYVVISDIDGICKFNFNKIQSPVKASPPTTPILAPVEKREDTNTGLVIAIVIIILVVVIAAIIFGIVCWYRNRQEQPYLPQFDDKDSFSMYMCQEEYNPQKYWNTVYSLRESRYIVAGRDYRYTDDDPYMNGSTVAYRTTAPLTFQEEFRNLPRKPLFSCNSAKLPANLQKNRFPHLLPYDHSRVKLDPDINVKTDYINANFIHGYQRQSAYIAVQSPFDEDTVLDFWRMIYQYRISVVVMVEKIVEDNIVKCTQYWPEEGRVEYGEFELDLIKTDTFADFCIRAINLRLKSEKEWQLVNIFEFLSWPEHGVPVNAIPLLEMRRKVRECQRQGDDRTPVVVHCGTGVSRTGTYIAIDALLEQYEIEGRISVHSFVKKIRKDRIAMVRTVKQYVFIYETIFEAFVVGNTTMGFDMKEKYHQLTKKNPKTGHSYLKDQFKCLQEFTRKIYPNQCEAAYLPANADKNRFHDVVPPDAYRPVLRTPGGLGRTDYINALFLDGYHHPNHFIITQTPLHTTVIDFWKLVYDYDINTIVMMENYKNEDDTCAEYWPSEDMKQYEPFFVQCVRVFQDENVTIRDLNLINMQKPKQKRPIRQFQFNAWSDPEFTPKSKSMLLDLIYLVKQWQIQTNTNQKTILIHCKDGATHSGLFCAVYILCEKFEEEGEVDVFHTIKHLKRRRSQIIDILVSLL
ncbi:hypothetical protein CHS0354_013594 [Potamilus streckersoni]|uniref:protein-tyrosine-phosphatase n=1 Tax=Potamilus streckersoni TaxID=2493646 RepID=A0AAE0VXK6_9BIVA|nr:hypothetical protein CHS0354_013594 [Potamilus streckersoni]